MGLGLLTFSFRSPKGSQKIFLGSSLGVVICCSWITILGDPGAVSQVGRKGGKKVFKYGCKSPWVLTLTISKNSSGCRILIGYKKCFALFYPIGEQFLLSSFCEFVHDSYCLATLARFVHQACVSKGNFYFLLS